MIHARIGRKEETGIDAPFIELVDRAGCSEVSRDVQTPGLRFLDSAGRLGLRA